MSGELAKAASSTGVLVVAEQKYGDDIFGGVSASGKWLPRLQLFGANSNEVKEGKIGMAHYGLVAGKDSLVDLGKEVDCLPLLWRPKAMDIGGDEIINSHDPSSAEFKRIQEQSEVRDSGCMFGPEFLIWVPDQKKWATYFCNSKTARRAAGPIRERLGKPCTMKAEFIKTAKYSWHGPVIMNCSTPFDLPTEESVLEETERFNNPSASDVERAPEPTTGGGRVR